MTAVLFRTGSGPINSSLLPGSPRFTVPLRHDSFSGTEKLDFPPSLHLEVNNNRRRISRAISEPQAIIRLRSISSGSQTFPEMLPEVEEDSLFDHDAIGRFESLNFTDKCFDRINWMPESGTGSGNGSGRDRNGFGSGHGNNNNNSNDNEQKKIDAHYKKMLMSNPNDPLILRNYGNFLHELEGDSVKAEECYGRAILVSPGDGELLSLYGKLIWDTQRDEQRAQSYFDRAISVSPDDCMVMGSYAQFMWEAEDDDEDEEESGLNVMVSSVKPTVAAF